jgi:hypothetical protein
LFEGKKARAERFEVLRGLLSGERKKEKREKKKEENLKSPPKKGLRVTNVTDRV